VEVAAAKRRSCLRGAAMKESLTFSVPGMSCDHCKQAVSHEVGGVRGVSDVDVDLACKLVRVSGEDLQESELLAAIEEAGYEGVLVPSAG